MRHGFEAITIKIESEDKRALERRCLEDPQYGRWNGPKSYADLVRKAIKAFLAEPGEAKQQAAIAKQIAGKTPQRLSELLPVHFASAGNKERGRSACGLVGLEAELLTTSSDNATCTGCRRILDRNARALSAPARARAPKKAANRRARR